MQVNKIRNSEFSSSISPSSTHLVKFASVCMVLAMRVRFRAAFSLGYSCVSPNMLGDKMAGHRKRRKMDALIRLSPMSPFLRSLQRSRKLANTSLSSLQEMRTHGQKS